MRKLVLACIIVAAILVSSIILTQAGKSPTVSPVATASPTASPSPLPTATPTSKPTISRSAVPYDFSMNSFSINLTQGSNKTATIWVNTVSGEAKSVDPHDVIWSADCGSTGMQTDIGLASYIYSDMNHQFFLIPDGFSSKFTITVPSSTPPNNYAIMLTAKIGSVSHTTSIVVSVTPPPPSPTPTVIEMITVSGTFNPGNLTIIGDQLQFILQGASSYYQFILQAAPRYYYATITENGTYSIDLPNHCHYNVCVYNGKTPKGVDVWSQVDTYFTVEVPAGATSITHDFTLPSSWRPPG